ncbi:META domain-containing protein [Brevibacterium spongiae]|uniref:META domain-containing protein n=1 Tax=Brevibacterium spongiae TaxID=2909672 RepID=A0ABY5SWX3_9MICO|nr:META domain-containing protein [Brevibacterium spongiae]UVI37536.1 META domain-containing protein [Brevibacterium spongiae]
MPKHTLLRPLPTSRMAARLALGVGAFALTFSLAACDTGVDPRNPDTPSPSESASSESPSEGADSLDPVGKWTSPEAGDPFLEFAEDGSLEGSDGCNAIVTTWKAENEEIVIDSFMSTQKACAGVDTWLSKASTATIEGDVMKVKDSNGKVIGGLEKEDK